MSSSTLASSARITAFNIAATAARPGLGHLVAGESRDLAIRFLEDMPRWRFWLGLIKRPGFHPWFERFQLFKVPGLALHQTLRNLSLEEAAIHGLEAGMDQIVILGGAFDTLAARLARRYPGARFLEIGQPNLLVAKRRVLEQTDFLPTNLTLLPMDPYRLDLREGLSLPGFSPDKSTFLLCEGLLMRMEARAVAKFFSDLAALPCPALRLAFTFMEPDTHGRIAYRGTSLLMNAWRRRFGRSFTWGISARELQTFLLRRGFVLEEIADAEVFRSRFLSGLPGIALAEGEKVAIASLASA